VAWCLAGCRGYVVLFPRPFQKAVCYEKRRF